MFPWHLEETPPGPPQSQTMDSESHRRCFSSFARCECRAILPLFHCAETTKSCSSLTRIAIGLALVTLGGKGGMFIIDTLFIRGCQLKYILV